MLSDERCAEVAPTIWVRAVADQGILANWGGVPLSQDRARDALATARELEDPALITQALIAYGMLATDRADISVPCLAEAVDLARATGDHWNLCQILSYRALTGCVAGEPIPSHAAAEEGRDLADALGFGFFSRHCRAWLAMALMMRGNLAEADQVMACLIEEAEAAGDHAMRTFGCVGGAEVLASRGEAIAAQAAIESAWEASEAMGGYYGDTLNAVSAHVALVAGDAVRAREAAEAAWRHTTPVREVFTRSVNRMVEAALASGDLATARSWADDNVAVVPGWHQASARTVRAFVAIAQGEPDQAERDAHEALAVAARTQGIHGGGRHPGMPCPSGDR